MTEQGIEAAQTENGIVKSTDVRRGVSRVLHVDVNARSNNGLSRISIFSQQSVLLGYL